MAATWSSVYDKYFIKSVFLMLAEVENQLSTNTGVIRHLHIPLQRISAVEMFSCSGSKVVYKIRFSKSLKSPEC